MIDVRNLSYVYNPKTPFTSQALFDVNLKIEDGDFFGIIGGTGAGKSTLVSHFNALTRVQKKSGTVLVDDMDLSGPKNLKLPAEEQKARAKEAIELVGLDYAEFAQRSPFELSGGQKRRVALAGVLAMRPEILVLDEPTAGLDPVGKRDIMNLVMRVKQSCPTVVMISHNMDEIAEYCNKIAVLNHGRVEGVFSPRELFGSKALLEKCGVELPLVTEIAVELCRAGVNVNEAILTENELVDELLKVMPRAVENA